MQEDEGDVSQLLPPVSLANGVLRIMSTFRTGTAEVQQVLGSECNVILECRKCQSLYRSVANFISHKRNYCRDDVLGSSLQSPPNSEAYAKIENINAAIQRKDLDNIVDRLAEKASTLCSDGVVGENKEATQRVQYFTSLAESVKERRAARKEQVISLSSLPGTSKAVAQSVSSQKVSPTHGTSTSTCSSTSPSPCDEISSLEERKKSRGRPRKICLDQNAKGADDVTTATPTSSEPAGPSELDKSAPNYCCEKCHAQFTTQKSLNLHETTQHMTSRMQYKCPCCKNCFCNLWSTYRHLKSIHRKSQEQVERMKPVIRKRAFKMTVPVLRASSSPTTSRASSPVPSPSIAKPKPAKTLLMKPHEILDKAWSGSDNNFTVDVGDHRCGICGLRFERRAALVSHTNTCHRKPLASVAKSKSPRSGSPVVDTPPLPDVRTKPEGAANRKKNPPVKILRGPRSALDDKPDKIALNPENTTVVSPKMKNSTEISPKHSSQVSPNSKNASEISPKTKNASEISPKAKIASEISPKAKNASETSPKTKSATEKSTKPENSPCDAKTTRETGRVPMGSSSNAIPSRMVQNGFPQSNCNVKVPSSMNPVVKLVYANKNVLKPFPQTRRASPNIIKKSTAKVFTSLPAKKPPEPIQTKSPLIRTTLLDKNVPDTTNGPKFIKLTPVTMGNSSTNVINIKTIVPFSLQKSGLKTYTKVLSTPTKLHNEVATNPELKSEILVRTVSDKMTGQCEVNGDSSVSSRVSTSSSDASPDKNRIGIQIRRDYAKSTVGGSENGSSRPTSRSSCLCSDDEDFSGWDAGTDDDYQAQLGLPQINDMNLVYQLISQDAPFPRTPSPDQASSPELGSPVKTRGMRELEASAFCAKRRKTEA